MEIKSLIEASVLIGTIRYSQVGAILEMIGIEVNMAEVIEEISRMKTGLIIEAEVEIGMMVEDLGAAEEKDGPDMEIWSNSRGRSEERRCYYCREPGHFMKECLNKKQDKANKENRKHKSNRLLKLQKEAG